MEVEFWVKILTALTIPEKRRIESVGSLSDPVLGSGVEDSVI